MAAFQQVGAQDRDDGGRPLGCHALESETPADDAGEPRRRDRSFLRDHVRKLGCDRRAAARAAVKLVEHLAAADRVVVRRHEQGFPRPVSHVARQPQRVRASRGAGARRCEQDVPEAGRFYVRARPKLGRQGRIRFRAGRRGLAVRSRKGIRCLRHSACDACDYLVAIAHPVWQPDALHARPTHELDQDFVRQALAVADGYALGVVGAVEEDRDPGTVWCLGYADVNGEIREADAVAHVEPGFAQSPDDVLMVPVTR
jgi:hypothetical protein